ncbi:MAG: hypothetical protein GY853_13345 [PVC group bacterium]|nr:hypothetical protein [PVC group bacterium]
MTRYLSDVKRAVSDICGKDYSDDAVIDRQILAGINWARNDIGLEQLTFLRTRAYINVTANTLVYDLASDFNTIDKIFICATTNEIGDVTTWTLDTSANKTGHVDAAVEDDVGEDSVIRIGELDYVIQSITGDGTAADSIELDYAAASGTVRYIGDEDYSNKRMEELDEAEYLHDITNFPASTDKNVPEKFKISGVNSAGTQTIFVGDPTSDDNYLIIYDYFAELAEMTTNGTEYALTKAYRDITPLVYGAIRYCYQNFWFEDKLSIYIGLYAEERTKVINKLGIRREDDISG